MGFHLNSKALKGSNFENEILLHLYSMDNIGQSMTTKYNKHGNSQCENV